MHVCPIFNGHTGNWRSRAPVDLPYPTTRGLPSDCSHAVGQSLRRLVYTDSKNLGALPCSQANENTCCISTLALAFGSEVRIGSRSKRCFAPLNLAYVSESKVRSQIKRCIAPPTLAFVSESRVKSQSRGCIAAVALALGSEGRLGR